MKLSSPMRWVSNSPEETRSIGSAMARNAQAGMVLSLIGELGTVKGLALGLGIDDNITSPTFTILHEYKGGRLPLFHMDFYRLRTERELDEIGFDEYLRAAGLCAIEWGDRFPDRLPSDSIKVFFSASADDRREIVW
jgi:tRNA threonylcarbamoyladenosine biosynthesis protein TsaE